VCPGAAAVGLTEGLEDSGQEVRGDPLSGVAHDDPDLALERLDPHLDPPGGRRELERVAEQVRDDLLQADGVPPHPPPPGPPPPPARARAAGAPMVARPPCQGRPPGRRPPPLRRRRSDPSAARRA